MASTAERAPEVRDSPSRATPEGARFLEEPPTVISDKKGDTGGRTYTVAELTLGRELVGQTLGHFHLDAFVGAGGMGAVFRGHDTRLDRRVAVKVLSGEHNAKEETVRRFQNEAQSAARLDHPNIARVYFVGEDKGWNYIVFEFIDGVNIRDLVERNGPLEVDLTMSYLVQIAEALDHAAERDVVHRDIKPSNILVDAQHRAKLVDMGLARLHQVNTPDNDLTASGMTLGTFDYISPEQARDPRSADVRSDLYSLGCTFFFMLTGRPPFPEGTVLQKLLSHSGEEPPDPREFRADVPDEVVHILSRLMAKNPADRYQTPGELIAASLVVIDDLALAAPHVTSAAYVPAIESRSTLLERHLPWALPVVILLVVVAVLDAIWAAKDDSFLNDPPYVASETIAPLAAEAGTARNTPSPQETKTTPIPLPESAQAVATEPQDLEPAQQTPAPAQSTPPPSAAMDIEAGPLATDTPEEEEPPVASAEVIPPNVLVVPTHSPTLYDAITTAQADPQIDTVELRFDGEIYARPLLLQNTSLTIRAGEGFRPTIIFTPQNDEPASHDRMILVSSSGLTMEGIHLRMNVPPASMRSWYLFALERADKLVLRGCQITVPREDEAMLPEEVRRSTAVVNVTVPTDNLMTPEASMIRNSLISFENSLVRGETTLVRTTGEQALRISCQNSLLALSGNVLHSNSTDLEADLGAAVRLSLIRCTVDTGGSVIRHDGGSSIPLRVRLEESALAWGDNVPLLQQVSSVQTTDEMRVEIEVDDNCYQLSEPMQMVSLHSTAQSAPPVTYDYAQWVRTWKDHFSAPSEAIWRNPLPRSHLYSTRTAADYALLEDPQENPAYRPGERNAGVDFSTIPFAAPSSSESTTPN